MDKDLDATPVDQNSRRKAFRERFQGKGFIVPSFITVIGLFCGFLALMSTAKGNFDYATKCIFLAIILDGLDGRVARRLNAMSEFGKEFDSLSDMVAFGVAPAYLMYSWGFRNVADEFGILIAFLYVACGAIRLARFNVSTISEGTKRHFTGLPIPAAAGTVAAVVYWHPDTVASAIPTGIALGFLSLLAGLMVSTIPFPSIKHVKLTDGNLSLNIVLLSLVVAIVWYDSRNALLLAMLLYVLSGPALSLQRNITDRQPEKQFTFSRKSDLKTKDVNKELH